MSGVREALTSGAWLQTSRGRMWRIDDPLEYPYNVAEIAGALAKLCRFCGHTREFYSVAQHSIIVARLVVEEKLGLTADEHAQIVLAALLHDAAEAFVCDLPSPIKRLPEMQGYRDLIKRVEEAISQQFFGKPDAFEHPAIKRADLIALATEKRDVLGRGPADELWGWDLPDPSPVRIASCFDPVNAESMFMATWNSWRSFRG